MIPSLPHRTLRCANGRLYLLMALCTIGCAAWAFINGRLTGAWQVGAAAAAAIAALLWAGYYAALRWEITPEGICRHGLCPHREYRWQDLQEARLSETSDRGVDSCCLMLSFSNGKMRLGSDLIHLDEVQALRDDLMAAGLLRQNS